jgi:shikimate kinase / 3-dehydroquinate synthase
VKHGAILDSDYFEAIQEGAAQLLDGEPGLTAEVVARSVALKAGVVSRDEKEGGLRQILNFGHTLGHALEAESDYRLPHGSSVAIGMVLEARLGEQLGVTREGVADQIRIALNRLGLPVQTSRAPDPDVILDLVSRDKKVRDGTARYVLLQEIGVVDPGEGWSRPVPPSEVRRLLDEAQGLVV